MPRNAGGTYSLPAGYTAVDGVTAEASSHNLPLEDIRDDLNTVRPVLYGGTGASTAAAARTALDVPGKASADTVTGDWTFSGALTLPAAVIDTAEIADDAVTRAKILDAAMSGDDATLITGTAGTSGNLAQWNADGDLVEGPAIIDEDDMATNSADRPPSQQSTKAYVDNSLMIGTATAATTSGSTVSISTAIPADVNIVEVMFNGVSLDGTDNVLVQLSTGATFKTSGYVGESGGLSGSGQSVVTDTTGFVINVGDAAGALSGIMTLSRVPSTETWVTSHATRQTSTQSASGGGVVTLGGALDGLRVKSSGSDVFDAGSVSIRWRK